MFTIAIEEAAYRKAHGGEIVSLASSPHVVEGSAHFGLECNGEGADTIRRERLAC